MKPTYNPSKLRRARKFGFRKRNQTSAGRKVLRNRRRKGRANLTASVPRRFRQFLTSALVLLSSDNQCYSQSNRLRKSWEFHSVKNNGKRFRDQSFWLQILLDFECNHPPKLGIIASRRFGNAIQRNRAKRRFREIFRKNIIHFPKGSKTVLLPRSDLFSLSYLEIEKKILSAIKKITLN